MQNLINKLHCENCTSFMQGIDKESVDMIITSPPYDNMRKYKGFEFDFEAVSQGMWNVIKPGGVCCWVVTDQIINGSKSLTSFHQAIHFRKIGFNIHEIIIFEKSACNFPGKIRYSDIFEFIFVLSKGRPKTFNPIQIDCKYPRMKRRTQIRRENKPIKYKTLSYGDKRIRDNIWKYAISLYGATKDRMAFKHPAVFPEKLASDCIESWSNEGDLVMDPMCGSGTVPKMAKLMKRNWIGVDISQEYIDLANQRIDLYGW